MAKKYLGVKLIEAGPMSFGDFILLTHKDVPSDGEMAREGYRVVYPDGHVSWSPKEVFEKAYFPLADKEGTKILEDDVDRFIKSCVIMKLGEKTTLGFMTLVNEFEIIDSSSCVDPIGYDEEVGREIFNEKAKDKVWELLGFLLQCGKNGVK